MTFVFWWFRRLGALARNGFKRCSFSHQHVTMKIISMLILSPTFYSHLSTLWLMKSILCVFLLKLLSYSLRGPTLKTLCENTGFMRKYDFSRILPYKFRMSLYGRIWAGKWRLYVYVSEHFMQCYFDTIIC